ncbi:MAG: hypothetical protein IT462_00905 [Planctomycetes bacterium]|nr:hypothetical protein [Planctomycetota bacterium]
MVHSDTKTFEQAAQDAVELQPHDDPATDSGHGDEAHPSEDSGHSGDHGHPSASSGHGDDHGHGGHDDHADHGHHAPPAPKYQVAPPARVGDVNVRTWVAYGIFLLVVLLVGAVMLGAFGR